MPQKTEILNESAIQFDLTDDETDIYIFYFEWNLLFHYFASDKV